jgi:8-oxo-dGTP pyrophosphatase MutT (NUDIX family)
MRRPNVRSGPHPDVGWVSISQLFFEGRHSLAQLWSAWGQALSSGSTAIDKSQWINAIRQLVFLGDSPNILLMKALKQVGALCVCRADDGALRVLLVTSRETGRWVIPKGWLAKGLREHKSAAREAMEEAGVSGRIWTEPIGSYRYFKRDDKADQLLGVSVFLLAVSKQKNHWPEQEQRRRVWFSVEVAARRVAEPELRALIRSISKLDIKPEWRVGTGSRA